MKKKWIIMFLLLCFLIISNTYPGEEKKSITNIYFILDCSASMNELVAVKDGKNISRFEMAKQALLERLKELKSTSEINVGLMAFLDCGITKEIKGLNEDFNFEKLESEIIKIRPQLGNSTPIAFTLEEVSKKLQGFCKNNSLKDLFYNKVILISDGIETCYGDPCKVAEKMVLNKIVDQICVIGLEKSEGVEDLYNCIAKNGEIILPKNIDEFNKGLKILSKVVIENKKDKEELKIVAKKTDEQVIDDKITFVSDRDGKYEIYIMNSDGTNQKKLTENKDGDVDPVWSFDGKKIIFIRNEDVFSMNPDGSEQTNLTNDKLMDMTPAVSFDGKRIAYSSKNSIYVIDIDGKNKKKITNDNYDNWQPSWSPDGKKIVYVSSRNKNKDVFIMNSDGSNQINLTNSSSQDWYPRFSPDGRKIAFTTDRDANWEIYAMNVNGSDPTRLTKSYTMNTAPSWSFDGRRIAFCSNRDKNWEIYVMNVDGSNQKRITKNLSMDWLPYWTHK